MPVNRAPALRVIEADYHRNGIAGEPFYIGIIEDEGRRMLITYFPPPDPAPRWHCPRIAVVDLDLAATGNIYMHPEGDRDGGNAWRGDHYQPHADAIVAHVTQRTDALLAELAREHAEREECGA